MTFKRLNIVLSNGLCIISAKIRQHHSVATIFLTDFSENTRVLFDMETGKIVANKDNIEIEEKDLKKIQEELKKIS